MFSGGLKAFNITSTEEDKVMSIWLVGLLRAEKMVDKYGVSFTKSEVLKLSSDDWPQELIIGMMDYLIFISE